MEGDCSVQEILKLVSYFEFPSKSVITNIYYDSSPGEMVIEYAGQLIRSTLTDKRERYYDSKGIGCYMFKIDDNKVIDATLSGTAARFINHSCDVSYYNLLHTIKIFFFQMIKIVLSKLQAFTIPANFPF